MTRGWLAMEGLEAQAEAAAVVATGAAEEPTMTSLRGVQETAAMAVMAVPEAPGAAARRAPAAPGELAVKADEAVPVAAAGRRAFGCSIRALPAPPVMRERVARAEAAVQVSRVPAAMVEMADAEGTGQLVSLALTTATTAPTAATVVTAVPVARVVTPGAARVALGPPETVAPEEAVDRAGRAHMARTASPTVTTAVVQA